MSTNHHYIPRYYIKGFKTDTDNELFVYDKGFDTLDPKKKKGTAGLFFKPDLNTIALPDCEKFSLVEDELFKKIDDHLSKIIHKLRDNTITDQFDAIELHGYVDIIVKR